MKNKTALLLVDHGSKVSEANMLIVDVMRIIEEKRPDLIVEIAHMELAQPSISEGFSRCVDQGASEVVVHPYMLAPGRHATQDIPNLVRDAAMSFPGVKFRVSECLGVDARICELVLDRAGV